jgi:hypothetical protein
MVHNTRRQRRRQVKEQTAANDGSRRLRAVGSLSNPSRKLGDHRQTAPIGSRWTQLPQIFAALHLDDLENLLLIENPAQT